MKTKTARPTPVDKSLYIKFTNKCRTNEREVNHVLTDLMKSYISKGEKIFQG